MWYLNQEVLLTIYLLRGWWSWPLASRKDWSFTFPGIGVPLSTDVKTACFCRRHPPMVLCIQVFCTECLSHQHPFLYSIPPTQGTYTVWRWLVFVASTDLSMLRISPTSLWLGRAVEWPLENSYWANWRATPPETAVKSCRVMYLKSETNNGTNSPVL